MPPLLFNIIFASIILAYTTPLSAQDQKYEKESRLAASAVPEPALDFIKKLPISKKIKWYKEEQIGSYSVEAKFKWKKRKYSVEFDSTGQLEDIEVQINSQKIPTAIKSNISTALGDTFTCFCVQKVQVQYMGDTRLLPSFAFSEKEIATATTIRTVFIAYELIVKGKKGGYPALYEVIFNQKGDLLKVTEIISKNANNLEY